ETAVRDLTQRMVLVDGRTEWVPSGVVEAMEYGRWLVLDEIDRAPPGVLSVLNNLLQFKEITLPDGRRIKAHENFRVIALMNPPTAAYAGGELSSELEDRFLLHYIDYLEEEEEVEYLSSVAPDVDKGLIIRLVRAANDLRADYRRGFLPKPFSTRGLVNVVEHLNEYPDDLVYGELYRVFNLKYISEEYQETVNKVFVAYELMKSPVEISPWIDADISEEDLTAEEGVFTPEEEDFTPEEKDIKFEEEDIEYVDERTFTITELEAALKGHTDTVWSLTTHGEKLVSGSNDRTIRVWDLASGKVKILKGHTDAVWSLTTHGEKLVSGSADKTLRVWDLDEDKLHHLALRAMLEGDLSDVEIVDDKISGVIRIGGVEIPKFDMANAVFPMGMAKGASPGPEDDGPLSISTRVLSNLARILSYQPVELEEWRPLSMQEALNPRPNWRVFKRGSGYVIHYVKRELRSKDGDIPLAVTGHEIFHLLFTNDAEWEGAIESIEEKILKGAFQWIMNAHEDPRVNDKGVERFQGLRVPLMKLYNQYYPARFKDLEKEQIRFNRDNPLYIQYGLMVVHDWFYGEIHPLVTDSALIELYKNLREESRRACKESTTGSMAGLLKQKVWPEVKKLVDRSKENMKEEDLLRQMMENMEIDLDGLGGERDGAGDPLPIDMMPKEVKDKIREKIKEKWDSLSDEEKEKILKSLEERLGKINEENNEKLDPKVKVDKEDIKDIREAFEEKDRINRGLREAAQGAKHGAGSGAGIGQEDFLEREGITQKDYDFYRKYYSEVAGQATTLKRHLQKIKFAEKRKRVLRLREEGDLDEHELSGVSMGAVRVFKQVRKPKGMYFKISFLVDLSGSMHQANRIEEAIKGLIVLLESVTDWPGDIVFEVAGYSNSEYIPISEYRAKDTKLKDKIRIIKAVHELGKGGTNAAEAVESAMKRNIKGDKKFRRIIFFINDGELLAGDAGKIGELIRRYPLIKLVPMGLGPEAAAVEELTGGRWLPDESRLSDEIYKIMDLEYRVHANGKHGFMKSNPEWGKKILRTKAEEFLTGKAGAPMNMLKGNGADDSAPGVMPEGPEAEDESIDSLNGPGAAYDEDYACILPSDHLHSFLKEERTYEIKYDFTRLTASQIEVIEEYVKLMRKRIKKINSGTRIELTAFSGETGQGKSLISVYAKGDRFKGEGHIDVQAEEGSLAENLLRLPGIINIAFVASNIPDDATKTDLDTEYNALIGFIKQQYMDILGIPMDMPGTAEKILEAIRYITLTLPGAYRLPDSEIEEYYAVTAASIAA
ncbi:MAG: AAA family ATPase, partial [Candidatus Omnitrophota bacterium]